MGKLESMLTYAIYVQGITDRAWVSRKSRKKYWFDEGVGNEKNDRVEKVIVTEMLPGCNSEPVSQNMIFIHFTRLEALIQKAPNIRILNLSTSSRSDRWHAMWARRPPNIVTNTKHGLNLLRSIQYQTSGDSLLNL